MKTSEALRWKDMILFCNCKKRYHNLNRRLKNIKVLFRRKRKQLQKIELRLKSKKDKLMI